MREASERSFCRERQLNSGTPQGEEQRSQILRRPFSLLPILHWEQKANGYECDKTPEDTPASEGQAKKAECNRHVRKDSGNLEKV